MECKSVLEQLSQQSALVLIKAKINLVGRHSVRASQDRPIHSFTVHSFRTWESGSGAGGRICELDSAFERLSTVRGAEVGVSSRNIR